MTTGNAQRLRALAYVEDAIANSTRYFFGGDVVRKVGPARRDLDEDKQRAGQEGVIRFV
jgi:hypothetical protein